MAEILISEKQLELIQDLITKEENQKLAEQNWKKFSDSEKKLVLEFCKELYPEKTSLIKENKWYNTLGDIVGIFDPTGVVDLVNGISYIKQGDNLFGFLSIVSAVPYLGDIVAKPVMGALKVGAPSAKALEGVLKMTKGATTVKEIEAASEQLAKISATGGITGKFVDGVGKMGGKLKNLIARVPMPGGLRRTLNQWFDLFANVSRRGTKARLAAQQFAKNMPKLKKDVQIKNLENLIKASKESGLFTSYRTSKGLLSWKTIFGGMPQLIGRNKSVRALVRQTKFWAGFLDFLGLGNFVGPDEALEKMGQAELESKVAEYQKTPEGQQYYAESFGNQDIPQDTQPSAQTSTTKQASTNPFGDFFKNVLGGEAIAAL